MKMNTRPKIAVIGSLNMDIVVEAERIPRAGETVLGNQVHFLPGGKGANQAVALARLGAKTAMIGCLGKDAFGDQLLRGLQADGIQTNGVKITEQAMTGTAQIVLAQGDNRIIVVPGANDLCTVDDIKRNEYVIAWADAVLLQLEIPLDTVEYAIQLAKKHGKTVFLNPAPVRQLTNQLLRNVDYLTPNEAELEKLTGVMLSGPQALKQAMKILLDSGVNHVVTTLGAEGAVYLDKQGLMEKVSGHSVNVVDTTGAGDCFNAGLIFALSSGKSVSEALIFANQVSALAVTKLGAQAGMPTLAEVQAYFQQ